MFSSESMQEHILYDKIYQYLWVKSETANPPAILIPDTVILIRSMPIYWYYTDKETGEIKKKMRKNVTKQNIKQTWNQQVGRGGVVAYLLHFIDNLDLNYPPEKLQISGQIQVIYFDVEGFNKFMDGHFELPFGILQQFIEPADDRNSQIQAFWSKSVTLFTKRVCKKSFTNKSMNIYERHCTFEGPEYFSEATQVKDFQSQRISEQIDKMISHLDAISYGKLNISQGTFYFKVDKKARCWFLFCGNLKFEDDKQLKNLPKDLYTQSQIKIPKSIDNLMSVYNSRPLQLNREHKCIRCGQLEKGSNFVEVPYHFLIDLPESPLPVEQWPLEVKKQAKQVKLSGANQEKVAYVNTVSQIPLTFQKIHEQLNIQNYKEFKQSQGFKYKTIAVCLDCYFIMVENQEKIAMQEVTTKEKSSMPRVKSKQFQRKEQSLNQFLNSTQLAKQIKSVKNLQMKQVCSETPTPKQNTIQKYVSLRLTNCKSITPIKYSIEVPSTADYLSRKTKSTYQDMSSTYKFKNSRDNYNQSLQERQQNRLIEIKDEQEQ
ncbi:unnamed protein product [Paramecium octaurelia]|uniref:Uncharacterized protein n=1 Tax=Paramecium octaurelia TaxID=43137 RepID=A0A8S1W6V7_PAROT|nr:unnamed protein product [Paramecium octaurelia]